MFPFTHHPDVAKINGVPVGYTQTNPLALPQFQAARLQHPGWGPRHIRQDVSRSPNPPFFSPRHRMFPGGAYNHLGGQAYTYGSAAGCPGQIMCADGRCVNSVTQCDDEEAVPRGRVPRRGGPSLRARTRRRRRALRNPTVADYVLGAFGLPGMPAYRSARRR